MKNEVTFAKKTSCNLPKLKFHDEVVQGLDLLKPKDLAKLLIICLCGKSYYEKFFRDIANFLDYYIGDNGIVLLNSFIHHFRSSATINFCQFNELLLALNQSRVSEGFYNYFFSKAGHKSTIGYKEIATGVARFRGVAMLRFGNFRFAYKQLSIMTSDEIVKCIYPYSIGSELLKQEFIERPREILEIEVIDRDDTWLLGETTKENLKKAKHLIDEEINRCGGRPSELLSRQKTVFDEIDATRKTAEVKGNKNTDIYLSWDYMDVYVATSMRRKPEFLDVHRFIEKVFKNDGILDLQIRYFDPTQSKCSTRIDKGLLEGLMLKRAKCCIYLVQESDTLGKDSELASTLAQGKPVIAFVKEINDDSYEEFFEAVKLYELDYIWKRIVILQAEGIVLEDAEKGLVLNQEFMESLKEFLDSRNKISIGIGLPDEEDDFRRKNQEQVEMLCKVLVEAEKKNFDRRANVLRHFHPLSLQVDLSSGVAHGVAVVRTEEECVKLLRSVLLNELEFTIRVDAETGTTVLFEEISGCPVRVVTGNERLTNSFWNFYLE